MIANSITIAVIIGVIIALLVVGCSVKQNRGPDSGTRMSAPPTPAPAPTPPTPAPRPTDGFPPPIQELHPVVRVKDGDTFVVDVDGEHRSIRAIGMDTPEVVHPDKPVQCYGPEASAEAKRLLEGGYVALFNDPSQGDVDGYGRWLYYVVLPDGTDFGEHMIRHGFATEYRYKNDYQRMNRYRYAQSLAMSERAGLWGACQ